MKMLPIMLLIGCAGLTVFGAGATDGQPGSTVGVSMGNEMVFAMQQSLDWLASQQRPDGSWGVDGDDRLTALIAFTLQSLRQPESDASLKRACQWLDRRAVTNEPPLDACAWRLLLDGQGNQAFRKQLVGFGDKGYANAEWFEQRLWLQTRKKLSLATDNFTAPKIPEVKWPLGKDLTFREVWEFARTVNQDREIEILDDNGKPVNWRKSIVQRLITTQRRDFTGTGSYWAASGKASAMEQTAFALLLMLEL